MIKRLGKLFSGRLSLLPLLAAGMAAFTGVLFANPNGGQVTNGQISITEAAGLTTINQTGTHGIIHWQDFSINAGEVTRFIQPGPSSATLNRVVGGVPSNLHGTLSANGAVYLINPSGILVGPAGRINTAGFVASTLDVPDGEFLAGGNLRFSGDSRAGVVNLGVITATEGNVVLLGRSVENAGTVNAPNGVVALAAGSDILMRAAGDELVVVNAGSAGAENGVANRGAINAAQAELKAAGGNVYELAVKNTGVVRATGLRKTKSGRIILSAGTGGGAVVNSGQLIAKNSDGGGGKIKLDGGQGGFSVNDGNLIASADDSSQPGGLVEMLGDTVTVGNGSTIDVSGSDGGLVAIGVTAAIAGRVPAIGGIETLAEDPSAQAAHEVIIQAGSRILANSTGAGNGGSVIVWSDKRTRAGGVIEATGGEIGGNGGFIETSGKLGLNLTPGIRINVTAARGAAGQWLLDPAGGLEINAGPTDTSGGNPPFNQNADTNSVAAADLVAALTGGATVVVHTSAAGAFGSRGIYVNADVVLTGANTGTLKLDSAEGITVNNLIGGTASGVNVTLVAANGNIVFAGAGNIKTSPAGSVILDTTGSASATISDAGTTSITAGKLAIVSGNAGVATSANPLNTAVANFEATITDGGSHIGGGVFIRNTGNVLHIGGVATSVATSGGVVPLAGILIPIPIPGNFGGVEINNVGNSLLLDSASGERIAAPGSIMLTASGAASNIQVANTSVATAGVGVRSHFGSLSLTAGNGIELGDFTTGLIGNLRAATGITLLADGSIFMRKNSKIENNTSGAINATTSLFHVTSNGTSGGRIQNTVGAITVTADEIIINGGATSRVEAFTTTNLVADKMNILSPVWAGGTINLQTKSTAMSVDLGTETPGKLSLTDAELVLLGAGQVNILAGTASGDITQTAAISGLTSGGFGLFALGGRIDINANLSRGGASVGLFSKNGIGGSGSLSAAQTTMQTTDLAGDISYTGPINTSLLSFTTTAQVVIDNAGNNIGTLGASTGGNGFGGIIVVDGVGDLTVSGPVTSNGFFLSLKTPGNLIINAGGSLSSLAKVQLDISSGNLINQNGSAAAISNRYVVYERDPFGAHAKGGLIAPDFDTVVKIGDGNNDPNGGVNSVFYYTNLTRPTQAPVTTPSPPRSPTGGPFPPSTLEIGNVVKPPVLPFDRTEFVFGLMKDRGANDAIVDVGVVVNANSFGQSVWDATTGYPGEILSLPEAKTFLTNIGDQSVLLGRAKEALKLRETNLDIVEKSVKRERDFFTENMTKFAVEIGVKPVPIGYPALVNWLFNSTQVDKLAKNEGPGTVAGLAEMRAELRGFLNDVDARAVKASELALELKNAERAVAIHKNAVDYWKQKLADLRMPSEKGAPLPLNPAITQPAAVNQPVSTKTTTTTTRVINGHGYTVNADGTLTPHLPK